MNKETKHKNWLQQWKNVIDSIDLKHLPKQKKGTPFHCPECNGIDGHRRTCPEFIR